MYGLYVCYGSMGIGPNICMLYVDIMTVDIPAYIVCVLSMGSLMCAVGGPDGQVLMYVVDLG